MGPGERIVNAVDFEIIDDYFCSTLKDLKVEKLNDLDFANKIQNIDTKIKINGITQILSLIIY
jgi:hypothetical protein